MLQNKNKIIFLGALAVSILISFPHLLVTLKGGELIVIYGLTLGTVFFRSIVLFLFAWTILSFNIKWKHKLLPLLKKNKSLFVSVINLFILFGFITIWVFLLKEFFVPNHIPRKGLFIMSTLRYLPVLIILLLLSQLVNLNDQHQQNLLEKEQAKQKALYHQLEALRTQLNPHFLFNALNSLNALIRQKSDKASPFVDKLSWLLRATLQRSDNDFITIQEELDYLEAYIFLQKERFDGKFNTDIQIPNEWKKELIPSFSLQLLVENAIKHNVVSQKLPLMVSIYQEG